MTSSRRPMILMTALLAVLGVYAFLSQAERYRIFPVHRPQLEPTLPGTTSVSGLEVQQDAKGNWVAEFDYFYTGQWEGAMLYVDQVAAKPLAPNMKTPATYIGSANRGSHHVSYVLEYPGFGTDGKPVRITQAVARIQGLKPEEVRQQKIDLDIEWPGWVEWTRNKYLESMSDEQQLAHVVELIDTDDESQLTEARAVLEVLIGKSPQLDQAYVELARVAMKQNWGAEGLHHAEGLLASALKIRPDSVNAKVLLGYVYTHQKRYPQAEALFQEAARVDSPNLWLWANWGQLLSAQGKYERAAEKYREAITRPLPKDTYARARLEAYSKLIGFATDRKNLDDTEALLKQRVAEFGTGGCYGTRYGLFLLQERGNVEAAMEIARKIVSVRCSLIEGRQLLGMTHYMVWANSGAADEGALNQARIYLPPGPMSLYLLASSDKTLVAAKRLIASGEKIDQKDNDGLSALAHALQGDEIATARRLLRLGARPDAPIGLEDMPVALLPVISGNLEAIRLLQDFGADYAKLRFRGATAFDVAKQTGNDELLAVLKRKPQTL